MEDEYRCVQGQTNTGIDEDKIDTMEAAQQIPPGRTRWWVRYVKAQLRNIPRHEIAERRKAHRQMEKLPV